MKKLIAHVAALLILLLSLNGTYANAQGPIMKNTDGLPLLSSRKTFLGNQSRIINIWAGNN